MQERTNHGLTSIRSIREGGISGICHELKRISPKRVQFNRIMKVKTAHFNGETSMKLPRTHEYHDEKVRQTNRKITGWILEIVFLSQR